MPAGFQSWDASGNLVVDLTNRIAKMMGTLQVGASYTGSTMSGTVTDSRFTAYAGCEPFAAVIAGSFFQMHQHPSITISGNTLTWTFPAGSSRPDTTIIYGIR
jgi:hypothetical protein